MTHQLFDEVVGSPPPSTVDVTGIVAREKRARSARRIGGSAAALVAVAVSAALMTNTAGAPAGSAPIAVPPPPSTVGEAGFRLVASDRESAQATAVRLRRALDEALREAAPAARWLATDLFGTPTADGQPPVVTPVEGERQARDMFYGGTGVSLDGRQGSLSMNIVTFGPCEPGDPKCQQVDVPADRAKFLAQALLRCDPPAADRTACSEGIGPNGERTLTQTLSARPPKLAGSTPIVTHNLRAQLADGRILELHVSNEYAGPGDTGKAGPRQARPPLTTDQLGTVSAHIVGQILP